MTEWGQPITRVALFTAPAHLPGARAARQREAAARIRNKLEALGLTLDPDAPCLVVVGGDGTFLRAVREYGRTRGYIGVNTGRLGFLQEMTESELPALAKALTEATYRIDRHPLLAVRAAGGQTYYAYNDVVVRGPESRTAHLDLAVAGLHLERFGGDGVIVATPMGSSAYTYSAGGALVPPGTPVYQVTPLAPLNTRAYRTLTSSCVLSADTELTVRALHPEEPPVLVIDGEETPVANAAPPFTFWLTAPVIPILRVRPYDFWQRVREKFLDPGPELPEA